MTRAIVPLPNGLMALMAVGFVSLNVRTTQAQWNGFASDPQHTGISAVPAQPFDTVRWKTSIDDTSPAGPIFVHYGSPVITAANTVVFPVRTNSGGYRFEARSGTNGSLLWSRPTDFLNPPSTGGWVPGITPTLTPTGQLYYQGAGGSVYRVDNPNSPSSAPVQLSFLPDYLTNKALYDSTVYVSTPLTSDDLGNVYFGFEAKANAPGGLKSGIARIAPDGTATYTSANAATGLGSASGFRLGTNSAPALSNDGSKLYIALQGATDYLVAVNSFTLAPMHRVTLDGYINDAGTSSPTVGPDGDVYFGVLPGYHSRGALQHFSGDLTSTHPEASFGWDETVSIIPASMVPSYHGTSSYLLMSKYNDYKQAGGTGVNSLAILDPNATQVDPITGENVMKEILTIAGLTPDPELPFVREWCINTVAVDPFTKSVMVNSEDGKLYRWDLATNSFSDVIALQSTGTFEAYTPTAIGPDGTVYAINKAELFAVGIPEPGCGILMGMAALGLGFTRRRSA